MCSRYWEFLHHKRKCDNKVLLFIICHLHFRLHFYFLIRSSYNTWHSQMLCLTCKWQLRDPNPQPFSQMVQIPLLSLKLQVWSLFRGKSPLTCTCTWHDNNIQLCLKFSRKREENTSTYSNWGRISQDEPQHKAPEKSEFQTLSTNLGCSFCTKRPAKFTFRQWKLNAFHGMN